MNITNRLQKLRHRFIDHEIDAILISQPNNRYYLSGFDGSAGFLVITPKESILATDFRYTEQAEMQAPDYEIFKITGDLADWLPRLFAELALSRLGFEAEHITFATYRQLNDIIDKAKFSFTLVPVEGLVESLRAIKEPGEIELITKAAAISDAAYEYIAGMMHTGMTEEEVAWEIEKFIRENGSQSMPFDIIIAAGPNSARPHARPSPHAIGVGEPVVIDIGAKFGGYSSDLTRTICLGNRDDTFNKIYDTVLRAQQVAIAGTKEGMTGEQVDTLARTVIKQAGYETAFGHGLGHGVGLVTHEQPHVAPRASDPLTNGMVFTIEPGIYLSGWGGVRIEDMVVMENNKARVLTRASRI